MLYVMGTTAVMVITGAVVMAVAVTTTHRN
jgi:hypothetical protein